MNQEDLQTAALNCLADCDPQYIDAAVAASMPVPGGYSRLTYRFDLCLKAGARSVILQYLPAAATGLVRVDRRIENDLLRYLAAQHTINAPTLITSDLTGRYFDSVALIFEAESGRPFTDVCRGSDASEYGRLNRIIARESARVQAVDIATLPDSMPHPGTWKAYMDSQIALFRQADRESRSARPFLRYLAQWLDENRPPEAPLSLVHGDLQVSNMIALAEREDEAVLVDWELAHIGDPREDLGWLTMVCGAIAPNILAADVAGFYAEYRARTGLAETVVNPATVAYFLIVSSIRTHYGMLKSSDALVESAEQEQAALAAYYMNLTTYQHMNWMNAIAVVEAHKRSQT